MRICIPPHDPVLSRYGRPKGAINVTLIHLNLQTSPNQLMALLFLDKPQVSQYGSGSHFEAATALREVYKVGTSDTVSSSIEL
ncbi:hypothetical protein J1614_011320 [Plenodomus biglobosus]|nr:hypothetical protein J1614_011320 [Plenodomus biglobosus]